MDIHGLIESFFNVRIMLDVLPQLGRGLLVTIEIALLSLVLGMTLGMLLAVIRVAIKRTGTHKLLRILNLPIAFYVDSMRSIPPLVTLVVVYFALPYLGVFMDRFWAAVMVFVLVLAAFASEIFRSGIEAIDRGQVEASRTLGLSYARTMRYVVVPQAFRIALPPLTSRMISITKDVSLASVIGVADLLKEAKLGIALSGNTSPLIAAAILFTLLFLPLVRLSSMVERKLGQ